MLDIEFEEWKRKTLQPGVRDDQIRDLKLAYYAGAQDLWKCLVNPMIGRSIVTIDLVQLVKNLEMELKEFDFLVRHGLI